MFKSTALKLSLYYLALIMGLSIGFSFFLYYVSNNELSRGLERPGNTSYDVAPASDYNNFWHDRLSEAQENLRINLLTFNLLVLVAGGFVSYALARRTLAPIEEAMEAQSRFTADASHELRTPLTAMQTEIEVALRNKKLSKENARKLLESNLEEVTKLRSLSEALLKLARGENNGINQSKVKLEEITTEAINRVYKSAAAKKLTIDNQLQNITALADREVLIEVVTILLDNAIKYSPNGSAIIITGSVQGQQATLAISDDGAGIDAKDLPHIFERFYRSDRSRNKNKTAGYGLGLAIADALMELQAGHIKVESTPGQGSTFTLLLPA
jgi:two-component system sensor histidine kinase CiaH